MKKYKIISILVLLSLFILSSCSLDEDPYGFYTEDNFYKTQNDAQAALYHAYDALTFIGYSRSVLTLNMIGSDLYTTKEGSNSLVLDQWSFDESNEDFLDNFSYAYMGINRANAVIENTPGAGFSDIAKDKIIGQAYFLRAWNYFNLVRMFGLVPIQTSLVDQINETTSPLAQNLDEVYDLIIEDLLTAEEKLTVERVYGLADKVAVQGLLSKVYLTIASSIESGVPLYTSMVKDVNTMYQNAATYANKVLNEQTEYSFDNNLINIYDVNSPDGLEHIFILTMDRTGDDEGDYSKFSKMFISWVSGANMYLMDPDGSLTKTHDGWSEYQPTDKLITSFIPGDKRLDDLIVNEVYDELGNPTASVANGTIQYPFTRKYIDPESLGDKTSTKPYLMRYSEIMLVYAEAVGPTTEGYEQINLIRNRAGLNPLTAGLSISDFRDSVLLERSWELAFEGHRLSDLRRKNLVKVEVPEAASKTNEEATFFPIPQREIDLNSDLYN